VRWTLAADLIFSLCFEQVLRACLPEDRVNEAVAEALTEAGHFSEDSNAGINFEAFMNMLKVRLVSPAM
jgi:hypothetical protein